MQTYVSDISLQGQAAQAHVQKSQKRRDMQALNQKQHSPSNRYKSPSSCAHKQAWLHPRTAWVLTSKMSYHRLNYVSLVHMHPGEFLPASVALQQSKHCNFTLYRGEFPHGDQCNIVIFFFFFFLRKPFLLY